MHVRDEVIDALEKGIRRGDSVYELQLLGVPEKLLADLDRFGILKLETLLKMTPNTLLSVPGIDNVSFNKIHSAIKRYDELEQAQANLDLLNSILACEENKQLEDVA